MLLLALMKPHSESLILPEETRRIITPAEYAESINTYLADGEQNQTLRPHQNTAFSDIGKAIGEGATKLYVTSPTGTGKTVLFVELSKAINGAKHSIGRTPRILVVEPTIQLVHQTLGRSGKT